MPGGDGDDDDTDTRHLSIRDAKDISDLPDECLAYIFKSLCTLHRESCSLVCRRWLYVEGHSRHCLSISFQAEPEFLPFIPSFFTRFDAVTELALKYGPFQCRSIGDDALVLISLRCPNLTRLKLLDWGKLNNVAGAALAVNCKGLKELYCESCYFGAKGMNAILNHCSSLEELSVKNLRGLLETTPIGPGVAAYSLKKICMEKLNNNNSIKCFRPLIIGSKNLKTLKICYCSKGNWDILLKDIMEQVTGLVEIHLEYIKIGKVGLAALSNCSNLEILHLVETNYTNARLVSITEHCKKRMRKLHISERTRKDKRNRGEQSLIAMTKGCPDLKELDLKGINLTCLSLELLATNCQNLERLTVFCSDTFGDAEISCIATILVTSEMYDY
ncbi:F-box protein At1g47056-like [Macadamia integrifolia]|uniref:F-box protein At1g47056-like n=1 Tax=Macadamia integrifolia TaxID=60698 RepID=UPI001C4FF41A|nr:F-box protein At1g47056-like [Macadamia integrifolia]